MKFVNDVHVGMRRAVQQESRDLYHSKAKQQPQGRVCLLMIMLSPLLFFGMILYVLSMYNALVKSDHENASIELLRQTELEDQAARLQQRHLVEEAGQEHPPEQQTQLLRKRSMDPTRLLVLHQEDEATPPQVAIESILFATRKTLVLTTPLGPIRIRLRPELSQGSVEYIQQLVQSGVCHDCKFYRAEKPGILQGIMANPEIPINAERGTCPVDVGGIENQCPPWDPQCGCHGPVMTRGSVAWAGGQAGGPDFFINAYQQPAKWWGTQHTNFGVIDDEASMAVVDQIFDLPVTEHGGMHHLQDKIHFALSLE